MPLIVHTRELALRILEIAKIIVSTEVETIAAVARAAGASVPFLRPAELAADNSPEWKSRNHATNLVWDELGESFDCFLSLPATSQLRSEADVRALLASIGNPARSSSWVSLPPPAIPVATCSGSTKTAAQSPAVYRKARFSADRTPRPRGVRLGPGAHGHLPGPYAGLIRGQ
jgi:hypothetical protein